MRFPLPAHPTANPSSTLARFITPHGIMAWAATDLNGRLPIPVKCEVRTLQVQLASAPGGSTSWIVELYVNGAAVEGTKIEIKGGATEGKWTGVLKLAANDTLSIRLTPVGEPAIASAGAGSVFATTFETEGNVFFFGAGGSTSASSAEAQNNFPYGINSAAWLGSGEELQVRAPIPGKFKLKAMAVDLSGAPGVGKSYTVAVRINGETDALPVKIEGGTGSTTGLATGSTQLNPADTVLLRCTPAGAPTARSVRVGIAVEAEKSNETFALGANFNTESSTVLNYTYVDTLRTAAWSSGHAGIWQLRPSGLTIKNLYVEIGNAPGTGKGRLYQFTMKEIPQPVEVEIKGAATKGSDTTHSFITNGERLDFRSFPLSSPEADPFGVHWGFVVTVPQPQTYTVGQPSETDAAQPLTTHKTRAVGQVTETDSVTTLTRIHTRTVGQPVETDVAPALTGNKRRAIGQVMETDTANSVVVSRPISVGIVLESSIALPLSPIKQRLVEQVLELDTAGSLAETKRVTVEQVLEISGAISLQAIKQRVVGQVFEIDIAGSLSSIHAAQVGLVTDVEIALPAVLLRGHVVGQVIEANMALPTQPRLTHTLGQVTETDIVLPVRLVIVSQSGEMLVGDVLVGSLDLIHAPTGSITLRDGVG